MGENSFGLRTFWFTNISVYERPSGTNQVRETRFDCISFCCFEAPYTAVGLASKAAWSSLSLPAESRPPVDSLVINFKGCWKLRKLIKTSTVPVATEQAGRGAGGGGNTEGVLKKKSKVKQISRNNLKYIWYNKNIFIYYIPTNCTNLLFIYKQHIKTFVLFILLKLLLHVSVTDWPSSGKYNVSLNFSY